MAIGIQDQNNVRRIGFEMTDAPIKGVSFAAAHRIGADHDLSSLSRSDRRRAVGAIICDHDQPIATQQLRADGPNRLGNEARLVVSRNQDGDGPALAIFDCVAFRQNDR